MKIEEKITERELMKAEKPARYTGGEVGMCRKKLEDVDIRFGFCFPDIYEIGMSCLGLSILYFFINRRKDTYCERFFAPWTDMEGIMREKSVPLFSIETKSEAKAFDILGFTLQYEMSYSNVLNMLDLGGISVFAEERGEDDPIVCAGGPCCYNPEPLADFFDFFYIGEGEVCLDEILDIYAENKREKGGKKRFLEKLLSVRGVYVPRFYDVEYNGDGTIKEFVGNHPNAPEIVEKVIVEDLDSVFFPEEQIVPFIEVVHDRVTLEVFRGCIRGCRFCQAGFIYRPVREKEAETLARQAKGLLEQTGHEEISLVSLSTGDYTAFRELAELLLAEQCGQGVNVSLPSLRIDAFTLELMERAQSVRKSGLTFAPEAGSQRMRDVINKNISEKEILDGCRLAFTGGWNRVKLYFMIGLPFETDEDLLEIDALCGKIVQEFYALPKQLRKQPVNINISAACFVPKPFTPFQWARQNTAAEFSRKQMLVNGALKKRKIRLNYHEPDVAVIEGVLARGDRRLGKVIYRAFLEGAKFESWNERFNMAVWERAFEAEGIDMNFYTRERSFDEILPWGHISVMVDSEFFKKEYINAENSVTTPDCRTACAGCGVGCKYGK